MSYCVNISCKNPQNFIKETLCKSCGSPLLLKERYRAIMPLNKGGKGRTFLAIDELISSKPQCLIKQFFIAPQIIRHPQKKALIEKEYKILNELGKHSQLPRCLDGFERENIIYLVQEFIVGPTLEDELKANLYNEGKIWQLLNDLLPVLQYIHERGVIHQDIQPENIIHRPSDLKPVLIDFRLFQGVQETLYNQVSSSRLSRSYIAPEVIKGKICYASDLYSLGVTCIHLITNLPPLNLYDFKNERWRWNEFLPPGNTVSYSLRKILDKMLEPSLINRYQSAAEVLGDVNLVLSASKKMFLRSINAEKFNQIKSRDSELETLLIDNFTEKKENNHEAETLLLINDKKHPQKFNLDSEAETLLFTEDYKGNEKVDPDEETLLLVETDDKPKLDSEAETLILDEKNQRKPEIKPSLPLKRPPRFSFNSARGISYTKLQGFLAERNWKDADKETWAILCKSLGLAPETSIDCNQIHELPCEDLTTLDRLWMYYSDGRFGFTPQRQIYESVKRDYLLFCDRVKWPSHYTSTLLQQLEYNDRAPEGHLPSRCWVGGSRWVRHLDVLGAKLMKCDNR